MTATRLALVLVGVLCASPLAAQTYAERFERAIFTEDTLGDLEGAIRLYGDLVRAPEVPHQIAVAAQVRLAAAERRRTPAQAGTPLTHAAQQHLSREELTRRLEQVIVDIRALQRNDCCGLFSGNYDASRTVVVSGTVTRIEFVNPQSVLYVRGTDGVEWGFALASPNSMIGGGFNRNTLRPGDQVFVNGHPATGAGTGCPAQLPHSCATLENGARHASATIVSSSDGRPIFDRRTSNQLDVERLLAAQRGLEQQLFGSPGQ